MEEIGIFEDAALDFADDGDAVAAQPQIEQVGGFPAPDDRREFLVRHFDFLRFAVVAVVNGGYPPRRARLAGVGLPGPVPLPRLQLNNFHFTAS